MIDLLAAYRMMLTVRYFEEECQRLYAKDLIRGSIHLGIGQEAVSVGACALMRPGDTMTCTYRGHAAVLATGVSVEASFAEIMGRAGGLCGGKGGSMHLTDLRTGAFGSFAIVGAHLPIATGLGWGAQLAGAGAFTLTFFGDGSTNIGGFHEALNLASVWKLPVIFVCENNLYGEYSPLAVTTPIPELFRRADSYGMAAAQVDGNDVAAVAEVVGAAVARARSGDGPTLVEAMTYRQCGHSRSDPAQYRPPGELEAWLERDPITTLAARLVADGAADEPALAEVRRHVLDEVTEASVRAQAQPFPDEAELVTGVWAS